MADNGVPISAAQDGAMYDAFAGGMNYIIGGIGNDMAINYNASSLNVTLAPGECVIRGRHITNTALVTLTLSANSSGKLVLRYNSSDDSVSFMTTTVAAYGNVNNNSTTCDLVFGNYTTDASGVSSFTSTVRKINSNNYPNYIGFYNKIYFRAISGTGPLPPEIDPYYTGDLAIVKTFGDNRLHFYIANANPGGPSWMLLGSVSV